MIRNKFIIYFFVIFFFKGGYCEATWLDGYVQHARRFGHSITGTKCQDPKKGACFVKELHSNGTIRLEAHYWDGQPHGEQRIYYRTGKLRIQAFYQKGQRHGLQKSYDKNGNIKSEVHYQDGKKHGLGREYFSRTKHLYDGLSLVEKGNVNDEDEDED